MVRLVNERTKMTAFIVTNPDVANVELVGNELNPGAHKSTRLGLAPAMLMSQCGNAEVEDFRRIELPGEQAFFRFVETDDVAQFRFTQLFPAATVENKSSPLGH